jgi:hypothetical protein
MLSQGLSLSGALCPKLQERQELGQVDETLGFSPFIKGQLFTLVLTVEQTVRLQKDPGTCFCRCSGARVARRVTAILARWREIGL